MPEWVTQLIPASLILVLVGMIWRMHEQRDREERDRIWDQLGRKSGEGMRKEVHDVGNIRIRVSDLERRVARIERHLNGKLKDEDDR